MAAARAKRFWRVCSSAFLAIHLVALAIVGFMVGDGLAFRLVAGTIVVGPVLAWVARRCSRPYGRKIIWPELADSDQNQPQGLSRQAPAAINSEAREVAHV